MLISHKKYKPCRIKSWWHQNLVKIQDKSTNTRDYILVISSRSKCFHYYVRFYNVNIGLVIGLHSVENMVQAVFHIWYSGFVSSCQGLLG